MPLLAASSTPRLRALRRPVTGLTARVARALRAVPREVPALAALVARAFLRAVAVGAVARDVPALAAHVADSQFTRRVGAFARDVAALAALVADSLFTRCVGAFARDVAGLAALVARPCGLVPASAHAASAHASSAHASSSSAHHHVVELDPPAVRLHLHDALADGHHERLPVRDVPLELLHPVRLHHASLHESHVTHLQRLHLRHDRHLVQSLDVILGDGVLVDGHRRDRVRLEKLPLLGDGGFLLFRPNHDPLDRSRDRLGLLPLRLVGVVVLTAVVLTAVVVAREHEAVVLLLLVVGDLLRDLLLDLFVDNIRRRRAHRRAHPPRHILRVHHHTPVRAAHAHAHGRIRAAHAHANAAHHHPRSALGYRRRRSHVVMISAHRLVHRRRPRGGRRREPAAAAAAARRRPPAVHVTMHHDLRWRAVRVRDVVPVVVADRLDLLLQRELEPRVSHVGRVSPPGVLVESKVEKRSDVGAGFTPRRHVDVVEVHVEDPAVPELQKLFVLLRRDEPGAAFAAGHHPLAFFVEPRVGRLPVVRVPLAILQLQRGRFADGRADVLGHAGRAGRRRRRRGTAAGEVRRQRRSERHAGASRRSRPTGRRRGRWRPASRGRWVGRHARRRRRGRRRGASNERLGPVVYRVDGRGFIGRGARHSRDAFVARGEVCLRLRRRTRVFFRAVLLLVQLLFLFGVREHDLELVGFAV